MNMLEVRHVSKLFGRLRAVTDVSIAVAPRELRAIIGPNGAGKTTFFNVISGFFAPTAGEILFEGESITGLSAARRVARGMARAFQVTEIFPELTVRDNVRISVEAAAGLRLRVSVGKKVAVQVTSRSTKSSKSLGSWRTQIAQSESCRTEISGRPKSRWHSLSNRSCCYSMSPQPAWASRRRARSSI